MTQFAILPHQEVDASLREKERSSVVQRNIPTSQRASCNLEWYLT